MEKYILSKNSQVKTDCHKIHRQDCTKKPKKGNYIELGECICPIEAKNRARDYYSNVTGCSYCCKEICSKGEKHI